MNGQELTPSPETERRSDEVARIEQEALDDLHARLRMARAQLAALLYTSRADGDEDA